MADKIFSERINDAQVMYTGMKNNGIEVENRGWTQEKNSELQDIRLKAIELNDQQEKLKAELKIKTAELKTTMTTLRVSMTEAKKVVKLGFSQEKWKEFGVVDKR